MERGHQKTEDISGTITQTRVLSFLFLLGLSLLTFRKSRGS